MPSNLTITVDDEALRRARIRALSQGTSVNALLSDFLEAHAGTRGDYATEARGLAEVSRSTESRRGGAGWTRDDFHEGWMPR